MDKNSEDGVVINAIIKRFVELRYPRALNIQKRVFSGETLNEQDVKFLNRVFYDAKYVLNLSDKHPEFQELAAKCIDLYTEITQRALENEKKENNQ